MSAVAWGSPPAPALLSGDEQIHGADATLRDVWAWNMSDLRTNTVRSLLAEFLVAQALGATSRPRVEWDPFDVLTPEGTKVEVKSGAYLQAWEQRRLSTVVFSGLNGRTWSPREGYSARASYNADAYVFAVLTATDHATYDALELSQWSFWVLPRRAIEALGQKSISLARVEALAGPAVTFAELPDRVRLVVADSAS
jgi:hypothetical protein